MKLGRPKKIGWYSPRAAVAYGSNYWLSAEGHEVEITHLLYEGEISAHHTDSICVGQVVKWARKGKPSKGEAA